MKLEWAVLAGAVLIAASVLFIERYQISAVGYGHGAGDYATSSTHVYRLDRWTSEIAVCGLGLAGPEAAKRADKEGKILVTCQRPR